MATVVVVHSFHQGTGRSALVARLGVILALQGKRVGIFEADLLHPTLCPMFGLPENQGACTANKYLRGECTIADAAYDLTAAIDQNAPGALFVIPASVDAPDILQMLRERFDARKLNDAFESFARDFGLDMLIIDAPAGENEASLVTTAICDALFVVLRLDQTDYLGTGIVLDVARQLKTPSITLVVNRVGAQYDESEIRAKLSETYRCEVSAVIPESPWMDADSMPIAVEIPDDDPAVGPLLALALRVAPSE